MTSHVKIFPNDLIEAKASLCKISGRFLLSKNEDCYVGVVCINGRFHYFREFPFSIFQKDIRGKNGCGLCKNIDHERMVQKAVTCYETFVKKHYIHGYRNAIFDFLFGRDNDISFNNTIYRSPVSHFMSNIANFAKLYMPTVSDTTESCLYHFAFDKKDGDFAFDGIVRVDDDFEFVDYSNDNGFYVYVVFQFCSRLDHSVFYDGDLLGLKCVERFIAEQAKIFQKSLGVVIFPHEQDSQGRIAFNIECRLTLLGNQNRQTIDFIRGKCNETKHTL